ncbi:acyltransferase family protein [Halioxenophilus aromaticivorans]|uniref:Acyltransferase family protein n=1 Tax=Halioxenophilus aromaticivorans TaxID=1306992 RepID=A0AAV3TYM5_9ALTE
MERLHHVDVAKGISIILVVANHSALRATAPDFFNATSSLRLPLFFFLSGIFFSLKWSPVEFVIRKADALLKPFFVTLVAMLGLDFLIGYASGFDFPGVVYASGMTISLMPLWFLPHLFLVHSTAYCIITKYGSYLAQPKGAVYVLVIGFALGAGLIGLLDWSAIQVRNHEDARVGWPFSLDVLPMTLAFFLAGYLLREKVKSLKPDYRVAILFGLLFLFINVVADPYLDFNGRILKQPWLILPCAVMGIYSVLVFSSFIGRFQNVRQAFVKVGQSGLIILVFHSFFVGDLYRWLLPDLKHKPLVHALVVVGTFLLGIAGPLLLERVIRGNTVLKALYLPLNFSARLGRVAATAK